MLESSGVLGRKFPYPISLQHGEYEGRLLDLVEIIEGIRVIDFEVPVTDNRLIDEIQPG
jgi:hypothetical protein